MEDKNKKNGKATKKVFLTPLMFIVFFLVFIWIEIRVFSFGQRLPINQSIFFFGLVNFNLVLLLGLSFFILRNLFKAFVEQRRGVLGNSLKSRLIAAFLGFSVIPTGLMFTIALFYINSSFDRWFSEKMQGVLKSALEVNQEYYSNTKKKNFNAGFILSQQLDELKIVEWKEAIDRFRTQHSLDVVEVYQDLESDRILSVVSDATFPIVPTIQLELLQKNLSKKIEMAHIHQMDQGNLIRAIVPLKKYVGTVVISTFIPISMISKMDNVAIAYEEMKDLNYPLKSIYIIVLILMTSMILVCSIWYGLYIAKHLSKALERLGEATQKVAEGNYQKVHVSVTEFEVQQLAGNFNTMVDALKKSREETVDANQSLKITLKELDEKRRYMQVVLANVNTGVISLDDQDRITMINEKAVGLLNLEKSRHINQPAIEVFGEKYYRLFRQMVLKMKSHNLDNIEKEVVFDIDGFSIPSVLKISPLFNEKGRGIGKVVVFDDLTDIVQGQRAAAWKEVARRIAHEIKNPLTPIKLSAQRIKKKFSAEIKDPSFVQSVDMIIEQTDSIKHLINEFSQFARLPETRPKLSDLRDVVEKVISIFEQGHRSIEFASSHQGGLDNFFFDAEQIKRVVLNLIQNAINAVSASQDPKITVETSIDRSLSVVVIRIIDNGIDVRDDEIRRMFEPYYSKNPEGSGLGLTIVKKIVEDHNGYIRLSKNSPRGLVAQVELPYIRA